MAWGGPQALTVFLLHHHGVADGQQAPELLHHPIFFVKHGAQEPRIVEKQFPIGKPVPQVGVLLRGRGGGQADSGWVAAWAPTIQCCRAASTHLT